MQTLVDGVRLSLVRGSITDQEVDAIVNAANTAMRGGGGVDGAIHSAAGPALLRELKTVAPNGAATGQVVTTPGFELPVRYILHVAGPVWRDGHGGEPELLATCYRNAIERAEDLDLRTIAFPSISTGIYGFPIERAAPIALGEAVRAAKRGTPLQEIRFVVFSSGDAAVYSRLLERFHEIHPSREEREDAGLD
ncbi:macro domain-containing protein [bacterium]|nr:MAG: macro domain-containing protein [bacterium]